ncbi:hypothetical protein ACFSR9_15335 [Deinococcus taklimakanensis]|uniref:Uncharacterized protein n=1 Tax=Deinococcus taklimakanensis TaxID=536443 RepID=A0ABW5P956_9DEIO
MTQPQNILFTPGPAKRRLPRTVRPLVLTPFTREDRTVAVMVGDRYLCEYLDDSRVPLVMKEGEALRRIAALPAGTGARLEAVEWS